MEDCQDAILIAEEAVLEALCFDFFVENPHEILSDLFEHFDDGISVQEMAWCVANDS